MPAPLPQRAWPCGRAGRWLEAFRTLLRDGCACKESQPEGSNDGARTGTKRAGGPGGGQGAGQKRAAAPADHRPESDRQRGSGKSCAFPLLLPVAGLRTGGAQTRRRQQELCSCVLPDGQDVIRKGEIVAVNTKQVDRPLPNVAGA